MNKIILALLLTFSLGASAQGYAHRSNPGDLNIAPAGITSVGAGNCPGSGCVIIGTGGAATAHATISGTYVATLAFYGSNDNFVTLSPLLGYPLSSGLLGAGSTVLASGVTGTWVIPTLGFRAVAVYGATWASNTSMGIRLDADPTSTVTPVAGAAPVAGTLTNTNDTVRLPISGGQWATARFTTTNGASGTGVALEVSIDGGANFFAGPMAKDVTSVSLNPPMFASGSGLTAFNNKTYEVPLPANCTHFQMRATGPLGLTANVTLSGGALYTPGVPVTAVLYDVTSSVAGSLDTGNLDSSGWSSLGIQTPSLGTGATWATYAVDDAGALGAILGSNGSVSGVFGVGAGLLAPNTTSVLGLPVPKRFRVVTNASGTTTANRFRIEARR